MATRYFKATFTDGSIHARSSMTRIYVKASLCKVTDWKGKVWTSVSFHMTGNANPPPTAVEAAPTIEIDAKEYRALKAAASQGAAA